MAGLYLHIPFCVRKCAYCDFVSFPCADVPDEYVDALIKEIGLTAARAGLPREFDTVFFGGGTPSLLSGGQFQAVMRALRESFAIAPDAEITLECNPGTASGDKLSAYREAGASRLSIGLQSASDRLLDGIGRVHDSAQFFHTVRAARDAGFENISADVMHGLPGQSVRDYLDTLAAVCELDLEHISAYSLILEENTPLYERVKRGEISRPDEDLAADMQDAGFAYLADRGYTRYEISNYAKPGRACRHNLNYWRNGEYLGFGVAAHSAARLAEWTRWANVESLREYYRALGRGKLPTAETIRLFQADEMFECVMLGLRLVEGVDRAAFLARFGVGVGEAYPDALRELRVRGWLNESESHIALTPAGLDQQNRALQYFM